MKFIILFSFVFRLFLTLISNSHPDIGNHVDWGNRFWQYGPTDFYHQSIWSVSFPNQPFGSIYLFAAISKIYDFIKYSAWELNIKFPIFPSFLIPFIETKLHIILLKLPFILAETALGYLIYLIAEKYKKGSGKLATILYLFNPTTFYNSAVWGQTDSLINLLALTGFYLVLNKKVSLGIFVFFSSFFFKLSLIFYLPIFLILLTSNKTAIKQIIIGFISVLIVSAILILPFSGSSNPITWLFNNYLHIVISGQGHMLNGNAFNLWYLFTGSDLTRNELNLLISGLSYRQVSQFIFICLYLPILYKFFKSSKNPTIVIQTLFLISLGSFTLLTAMHERYLYPIFPLITILVCISSLYSYKSLFMLTIIHLLNLYNLWFYPHFDLIKNFLLFNNFLFGKILSIILIIYLINTSIVYFKNIDQK
ncbi:MAG TPA: hypothetical protein PK639_01995 [Candidatus Woesebacteria bacterium]|nr:hypothetical protein [Candidatus Woesebacteria bacterium]